MAQPFLFSHVTPFSF